MVTHPVFALALGLRGLQVSTRQFLSTSSHGGCAHVGSNLGIIESNLAPVQMARSTKDQKKPSSLGQVWHAAKRGSSHPVERDCGEKKQAGLELTQLRNEQWSWLKQASLRQGPVG